MGALEFAPTTGPGVRQTARIQIDKLVDLASEVLTHRNNLQASFGDKSREAALKDILRVGTSAGGARAKAVIAWNPSTNEVRSGQLPAGDGFDSSRDMVAFYARDGGADGNYYFRVDFQDLQPFAEEGNLDIYVVIDTGNEASGESALPDEIDILTEMKWEVVVASYQSNTGRV